MTEKFDLPMADYNQPKLLYCSNGGQFLRILPDGKVDGTRDRSDNHNPSSSTWFPPIVWSLNSQNFRGSMIMDWVSLFPFTLILLVQLLLSTEYFGAVYIKGIGSGLYLAMDVNGRLHGSLPTAECVFLEKLEENNYNTYKSKMHADKNWYVALKKNGNSKLGPKTNYGQNAILFLPLPVSPD